MCFGRFFGKKEKPYVLNVVERWPQFKYPGPALACLGKNSGEEFLHKYLIPVLEKNDKVIINLSDMVGYPSSWLNAVFGGIVDINDMRYLGKIHDIVGCEKEILSDIRDYIEDHMRRKKISTNELETTMRLMKDLNSGKLELINFSVMKVKKNSYTILFDENRDGEKKCRVLTPKKVVSKNKTNYGFIFVEIELEELDKSIIPGVLVVSMESKICTLNI